MARSPERAEQTLKAWEVAPSASSSEEEGDNEAKTVDTPGDCAYGSAENRCDFAGAGRPAPGLR